MVPLIFCIVASTFFCRTGCCLEIIWGTFSHFSILEPT
jgi:hypothetical protein